MLLPIMYHHIGADNFSNRPDVFRDHLLYIQRHFHVILPGEPLATDRPNTVLTFDDAGYSFYHYVFPILKEFNLRALLGVPVRFILEDSANVDSETRLDISTFQMMRGELFKQIVPFCTWKELREMSECGVVRCASHSLSHVNLLQCKRYAEELTVSQEVLQAKLGYAIDSFVFPYGEFNREILAAAHDRYRYLFAVGGGDNRTWDGIGGVLFRLYGDELPDVSSIFNKNQMRRYILSYYKLKVKKWLKDRQPLAPRDSDMQYPLKNDENPSRS